MIERKEYMNLLEKWRDKKTIKVVTGIRRCGKSSLLRMFREKLLSDGVSEEQVQDLNFEDLDNEPFLDYKILYAHVKQNLYPDKMNSYDRKLRLCPHRQLYLLPGAEI